MVIVFTKHWSKGEEEEIERVNHCELKAASNHDRRAITEIFQTIKYEVLLLEKLWSGLPAEYKTQFFANKTLPPKRKHTRTHLSFL